MPCAAADTNPFPCLCRNPTFAAVFANDEVMMCIKPGLSFLFFYHLFLLSLRCAVCGVRDSDVRLVHSYPSPRPFRSRARAVKRPFTWKRLCH